MLGAIIGDIVGSRFEFNNHRSKDFELFSEHSFFTDDTVMTIAVAKALKESAPDYDDLEKNAVRYMREIGRHYGIPAELQERALTYLDDRLLGIYTEYTDLDAPWVVV